MDFRLFEAVRIATGWVQHNVVDLLAYGFQPVRCVPFCGCHRPVCEKAPEPFSAKSNLELFDKASELLHQKACKAQVQDVADAEEVWATSFDECDKGFCVGPLPRRQVADLFKDAPHGPRYIPAFGIWKKEKLRVIDDA